MESFEWYIYPLAILAGIVAGIINTLAGSGSLVTLPMLMFMGLPAHVANATNRVGVVLQNIVGIWEYNRGGKLNMAGSLWLMLPIIPGGIFGAWLAAQLGAQQMEAVIGVVMVIMLFVILFRPEKWLREVSEAKPGRPPILTLGLFFLIGAYGAFIQAGVGVFILAALVLGAGYTMVHANGIKLVLILAVTLIAVVIFLLESTPGEPLIDWGIGGLMAIGQSIGAWVAARFATRAKNANLWVRRLLIAVVVISILDLFGILPWLIGLVF
ncbi:MAG: sulfite exporter TauE/SafE family protein [Litorilinea sp.]